jgi:hypothetical protein
VKGDQPGDAAVAPFEAQGKQRVPSPHQMEDHKNKGVARRAIHNLLRIKERLAGVPTLRFKSTDPKIAHHKGGTPI